MLELPATLCALQQEVAGGRVSAQEALTLQRNRLRALDADNHAVIHVLPEDDSLSFPTGSLAGIGLAHKDIFDIAGRRPGVGHNRGHAIAGLPPAPAIARLEAAGASTLAMLAMAEHACGATADNRAFERCVNPLHPQAVVGGSSSGSAVAVASGMAYGSLGTDTAGSVRIPAATCGMLGLKTTHGLVPLEGVRPLAPALDSVGVLARSAADARQLLLHAADQGLQRPASTGPLRVKAWLPATGLHDDVAAALENFMQECQASEYIPVLPQHATLTRLAEIVLHTEAAATHHRDLLDCTLSAAVEAVALPGLVIPPAWYQAALADRARHAQLFVRDHLRSHDVLLMPALPQPVPDWRQVLTDSPDFDVKQLLALHSYMGFVNYLGFPSVVFPIARDARGLPISVQALARPLHEADLLALAEQAELRRFGTQGFTDHFLHQG